MKLIYLQNGDWIDPTTITAIRPADQTEPSYEGGPVFGPRVIVTAGEISSLVYFDDFAQALVYAREIAQLVNITCKEVPST